MAYFYLFTFRFAYKPSDIELDLYFYAYDDGFWSCWVAQMQETSSECKWKLSAKMFTCSVRRLVVWSYIRYWFQKYAHGNYQVFTVTNKKIVSSDGIFVCFNRRPGETNWDCHPEKRASHLAPKDQVILQGYNSRPRTI